jgi:hypothetical protein
MIQNAQISQTLASLKKSKFRSKFKLSSKDRKYIQIKGIDTIRQHATATCCRGCIQKWHGIKKGKVLNDQEIELVVGLVMGWIEG